MILNLVDFGVGVFLYKHKNGKTFKIITEINNKEYFVKKLLNNDKLGSDPDIPNKDNRQAPIFLITEDKLGSDPDFPQ